MFPLKLSVSFAPLGCGRGRPKLGWDKQRERRKDKSSPLTYSLRNLPVSTVDARVALVLAPRGFSGRVTLDVRKQGRKNCHLCRMS